MSRRASAYACDKCKHPTPSAHLLAIPDGRRFCGRGLDRLPTAARRTARRTK